MERIPHDYTWQGTGILTGKTYHVIERYIPCKGDHPNCIICHPRPKKEKLEIFDVVKQL